MQWSTLIASAGVSAVVGAVVSLFAVSQVAVRQARAIAREDARRSVRELADAQVRRAMRYAFAPRDGDRAIRAADDGLSHLDDHSVVAAILVAARGLSAPRRWLVRRRCRAIFGNYWTELALLYPAASANGEESFLLWLTANAGAVPIANDSCESLMHRAYSKPPGDSSQDQLRKQFARLSSCR